MRRRRFLLALALLAGPTAFVTLSLAPAESVAAEDNLLDAETLAARAALGLASDAAAARAPGLKERLDVSVNIPVSDDEHEELLRRQRVGSSLNKVLTRVGVTNDDGYAGWYMDARTGGTAVIWMSAPTAAQKAAIAVTTGGRHEFRKPQYGQKQLEAVTAQVAERFGAGDPSETGVFSWGIDAADNRVIVGLNEGATKDLIGALTALSPAIKIRQESGGQAHASRDDGRQRAYGGMRIIPRPG